MTAWHRQAREVWPKSPIGYMLLLELTDRAGKRMHGGDWQSPQPDPPTLATTRTTTAFMWGPQAHQMPHPEFESACRLVAAACEDGRLATSYRFADGDMRPVPPEIWHRANWLQECFEWGCAFLPGGEAYWIFVRQADIDAFIAKLPRHNAKHIPKPSNKRGPRTGKTEAVAQQMLDGINGGTMTRETLAAMSQKTLQGAYGVARGTACKARNFVLGIVTE